MVASTSYSNLLNRCSLFASLCDIYLSKFSRSSFMILIDSSFDVLQLIEFDLSFNANEYDMNLLIGKNKIYLICESLFIPYAANTDNMIILKADYEKYLINNKTFINEIRNILHKHKIKKIGLVNAVLKRYFKDIETFGFISPLKTLGIVKSAQDIKLYRMCALMIKKVLSNIEDLMVQVMSDVELRNVIDINLYNAGAQRRYVPTLTGFNAKTVYPTLNGTLLKNGDMVLIDFGVDKSRISTEADYYFDLNLDMLDLMGLAKKIKQEFMIGIPDNEVLRMERISDTIYFLEKKSDLMFLSN